MAKLPHPTSSMAPIPAMKSVKTHVTILKGSREFEDRRLTCQDRTKQLQSKLSLVVVSKSTGGLETVGVCLKLTRARSVKSNYPQAF
jgi:hypothetical protein